MLENQSVYIEDKKYVVVKIKRQLLQSGNSFDGVLEAYLE